MNPEDFDVELPEDAIIALDQLILKAQRAAQASGSVVSPITQGLENPLQRTDKTAPMPGDKTVKLVISADHANALREIFEDMILDTRQVRPDTFATSTIDRTRPPGP